MMAVAAHYPNGSTRPSHNRGASTVSISEALEQDSRDMAAELPDASKRKSASQLNAGSDNHLNPASSTAAESINSSAIDDEAGSSNHYAGSATTPGSLSRTGSFSDGEFDESIPPLD